MDELELNIYRAGWMGLSSRDELELECNGGPGVDMGSRAVDSTVEDISQ